MQQKPRILILSTAYLPLIGGSELAIKHITDRLPEYQFDLVTGRYHPDLPLVEEVGRVRVFRAGGRLARLTVLLPKNLMPLAMAVTAFRLMRTHRYVLVHAYQASQAAGAAWLLTSLYPRVPLILTLQEGKVLDDQPMLVRFFRKLIFRSADHITVISSYLAAYARRHSRAPIDIIPNGVDLELFVPGPKSVMQSETTIMSISRLVAKNGLINLIKALPIIRRRVPARLVLVGEGPMRAELERLATDLEVAGVADFVGSVPHDRLPAYLHDADVFVRPSLSEGLGTAFLEAMAAGVPVVATGVGGIVDFLEDEKTGLICDPARPDDIANQVIRLVTDPVLRAHIIERAHAMVQERYSWDRVARQMERVYHQVARP